MAHVIRTVLAVSEGDGDPGDPRGAIELTPAPSEENASTDGSCVRVCTNCGALLRLMLTVCAPKPVAARNVTELTILDSQ